MSTGRKKGVRRRPWEQIPRERLPLITVPARTSWYRVHRRDMGALWFGPDGAVPLHRFDAPDREYRICYFGATAAAAFVESFLRDPPVQLLPLSHIRARRMSQVALQREVRLVRLHSDGLVQLGATALVASGSYGDAGQWARALWAHQLAPDGIEYRSRHDDALLCIALFDRAADAVRVTETASMHDHQRFLAAMAERYGLGF